MQINDQVLVSIIIPLYNKEKWIIQTLESVKNQDFSNWECIIVDDGSTDGSAAKVKEYISNNPGKSWKLITQKNAGQAVARNSGMKMATGKYISLLDADDYWLPNKLSVQVSHLESSDNYDSALCSYVIVNINRKSYKLIRFRNLRSLLNGWISFSGLGGLPESTLIFHRKFFDLLNGFDETYSTSGGLDYIIRLSQVSEILIISEPLVLYRINEGQWHKNEMALKRDMNRIITNHCLDDIKLLQVKHTAYYFLNSVRNKKITQSYLFESKEVLFKELFYIGVLILKYLVRSIKTATNGKYFFWKSLRKDEYLLHHFQNEFGTY